MKEQFENVPIEKIFESPLNPRRTFNSVKMQELIDSVRTHGILMPLVVRPNDGRYEIAAGHRRYRAAISLSLEKLPLIIREMNDKDFMEILTIENLQREDIEPLDEAQGYRMLMEKANYDVPSIAAKVGKSDSYIYQRLKLLELIPGFQEMLSNGKITAGHAILLARLQPNQQKDLLKKESGLYEGWGVDRTVVSVRDLARYIERQIHLDLHSASFPKADADLVPEAGPCTICHKRTGFLPQLFPDIQKKDTCTDPPCFHKKVQAFTDRWIETKSQDTDQAPLRLSTEYDGRIKKIPEDPERAIPSQFYHDIEGKKDHCESEREGIVVDGRGQGQVKKVCVDPKCEKHHGRRSYDSPETATWRAQQRAQEEKRKNEEKIRVAIMDETMKRIKGDLSREDLAFLAGQLFEELWSEYEKKIMSRHEVKPVKGQYIWDKRGPMRKFIEGLSKTELYRLLMEMALIRNIESRHLGRKEKEDPLLDTAKRYGVDTKKIEAEFRAEIKAKEAEKKAKAKKKSPSVKQKAKRADPPKAKTMPLKDLCKLHGPAKKKEGSVPEAEAAEIRIPVDQKVLAMIDESYSGDMIAEGKSQIRRPFEWEGALLTCIGGVSSGVEGHISQEAWKIVPADQFKGETYSYDQLTRRWDKDESQRGNHHGRWVIWKKERYVLIGPKITFYDGKTQKESEKSKSGVCRVCGCTHEKPCFDPLTMAPCAWTDETETLCTTCQRKEEREKEHHWEKQNLVTLAAKGKIPSHDIYKCKKCGAMGKRFGVGPVRPDKPFTELKCPGPKKEVQTAAKKSR